jgi:septum site-determining protein MinC
MPLAIAGRAPATFEIKSANLPLVALLLKSADLAELAREFDERFGELPQFFEDDALVVDLSLVPGAELDLEALARLLRRHRLVPVALRGGTPSQMEAGLKAGWACAKDAIDARPPAPPAPSQPAPSQRQAAPSPSAPDAAPAVNALIVDRPLRSGQQVYARGRDLVVMSMVNPGAEVIADGNIHVYAPLRGKAIAGARGNAEARILTLCLEPQLVSIAGIYRTSEVPFPQEVHGKAAQIRLVGDRLVVSGLQ